MNEDQFILELLQEVQERRLEPETANWSDEEKVVGFRSNHHPDLIRLACAGDVAALAQLRLDSGLPILA